jgi:hypothetical protein
MLGGDAVDQRQAPRRERDEDDGAEVAPARGGDLGARQRRELALDGGFDGAAKAASSVIRIDCAAVSCSAWASRSAAIQSGSLEASATTSTSEGRRSCRCRPCRTPGAWRPRHRRCRGRRSWPRGDRLGAVGERGDGLRAADAVDLGHAGEPAATSTSGLISPPGAGTTMTMRSTPATGRHGVHQHRARIARRAARHVEADRLDAVQREPSSTPSGST